MLSLPTKAAAAAAAGGAGRTAVTTEVILGLFWSGFGCSFFLANMIEFWYNFDGF